MNLKINQIKILVWSIMLNKKLTLLIEFETNYIITLLKYIVSYIVTETYVIGSKL